MESKLDANFNELKLKYYCKINQCSSRILNANVGEFQLIELPNNWPINVPVTKNANDQVAAIKLGSIMDFDNVGVSKAVENNSIDYRFLTCSDCDQGPIGYLIYPKGPAYLFCDLVRFE